MLNIINPIVAARNVDKCRETINKIKSAGGDCIYVKTDVSKADDVKMLVQKTIDTYGRLDCAVNSAGMDMQKPFLDWTDADWDAMIDTNLKGVWLCMKNEIPPMLSQGGGAIVNIASIAALVGLPMLGPYVASKHGVLGLSRSASVEFAEKGIGVNTICPGVTDTPMLRRALGDDAGNVNMIASQSSMKRVGKPEEIAAAALWLCSDESSYVTGIALSVDGGWSQH